MMHRQDCPTSHPFIQSAIPLHTQTSQHVHHHQKVKCICVSIMQSSLSVIKKYINGSFLGCLQILDMGCSTMPSVCSSRFWMVHSICMFGMNDCKNCFSSSFEQHLFDLQTNFIAHS
jgi:hypothetical protein